MNGYKKMRVVRKEKKEEEKRTAPGSCLVSLASGHKLRVSRAQRKTAGWAMMAGFVVALLNLLFFQNIYMSKYIYINVYNGENSIQIKDCNAVCQTLRMTTFYMSEIWDC